MRRRRVDFPQPLGPISAVVRPGGKARSVGCSAAVPPKLLLTPTNSMSGCMQMQEAAVSAANRGGSGRHARHYT